MDPAPAPTARRPTTPRVVSPRSKDTVIITGDQKTFKGHLAKAKESAACLLIVHGTPVGHRYFITKDEMTIGRDLSECLRVRAVLA